MSSRNKDKRNFWCSNVFLHGSLIVLDERKKPSNYRCCTWIFSVSYVLSEHERWGMLWHERQNHRDRRCTHCLGVFSRELWRSQWRRKLFHKWCRGTLDFYWNLELWRINLISEEYVFLLFLLYSRILLNRYWVFESCRFLYNLIITDFVNFFQMTMVPLVIGKAVACKLMFNCLKCTALKSVAHTADWTGPEVFGKYWSFGMLARLLRLDHVCQLYKIYFQFLWIVEEVDLRMVFFIV